VPFEPKPRGTSARDPRGRGARLIAASPRQVDRHSNVREQRQSQIRFNKRAAHADVEQTSLSVRTRRAVKPNRNIHGYALSPSVLHNPSLHDFHDQRPVMLQCDMEFAAADSKVHRGKCLVAARTY
jgi:hypothetical protein